VQHMPFQDLDEFQDSNFFIKWSRIGSIERH
jgi:hypothetical protein